MHPDIAPTSSSDPASSDETAKEHIDAPDPFASGYEHSFGERKTGCLTSGIHLILEGFTLTNCNNTYK